MHRIAAWLVRRVGVLRIGRRLEAQRDDDLDHMTAIERRRRDRDLQRPHASLRLLRARLELARRRRRTLDPLTFTDLEAYPDRVREAQAKTGLSEAIITGRARIDGNDCVLAVMDFSFLGGILGFAVGAAAGAAAAAVSNGILSLVGGLRFRRS